MKLLFVTGEDFSAVQFEEDYPTEKHWLALFNELHKKEISRRVDEEETYYEITAKEFGEVDPDFISFLRARILDYDQCKDTNFYIVEE